MQEKPEKWTDPEVYRERRRRTFKLYLGQHWHIPGNKPRQSNRKQEPIRELLPEFKEWMDNHNFPHRLNLASNGRSKIVFEQKSHAMLFKLTWT